MAEIKWNKVGECLFETDDINTNFAACMNTIAEAFGLTLESETSTAKYYKIESLLNGGIIINLSSTSMVFGNAYYTQENGTFMTLSGIGNGSVYLNNSKYGIRCYKIEMGEHSIYVVRNVVNNIDGDNICCFGVSSLTDYFSGQTCKVIMGSSYGCSIDTIYAYEKTTKKYISLSQVYIGGNSYPTKAKGITVAVPVFWQNVYNYGYLGNSPDLYRIYPNMTMATNEPLGTQIQINGRTFERLGNNLFVRTG